MTLALCLMLAALAPWQAEAAASAAAERRRPPLIEGVVRGPDGAPVARALVIAAPAEPSHGDVPLTEYSDTAGRFRLELVRAVPHVVRVEAEGLAPERRDDVAPGASLEFVLRSGVVLTGTVHDAATGDPIPEARVSATVGRPLPWVPEAGIVASRTDRDGRFRLTGLRPGRLELRVAARGYRLARQGPLVAQGDFRLLLARGGASIEGMVVDPGGRGLGDVVVRAEPEQGEAPSIARSAEDGRFALDSLEPGRYTIVARRDGFAPTFTHDLELEEGRVAQVPLRLWPGAAVTGRLVTDEGKPAAGTVSFAQLDGSPVPGSLLGPLTGTADAGGRFRIEAVPPGAHVLEVSGAGYAPLRRDVSVGGRDLEVDVGDIALREGLSIRGRVQNPAAQPIAGARVRAFEARPVSGAPMGEVTTGADGAFEIRGLEAGGYRLIFSAEGHAGAHEQASAGTEDLYVVLSPAATITGLVVDASGGPVPAASVSAWPARGFGTTGQPSLGADGRFRIEGLAEGTYVVEVTAPDLAPARLPDVRATMGAEVDVGLIRLSSGARVVGSVSDPSGGPVAGATVTVRGPRHDAPFVAGPLPAATTGADGRFEVRGLPAGIAVARARHPEYAEAVVSGIELNPARAPAEIDFVLGQGGRIEGWLRSRDGTPPSDAHVMLSRDAAHLTTQETLLHPAPDGSFTAEHVTPGRLTLTLMLGAGPRTASAQTRQVDVLEGETTRVEFVVSEILVTGRVTRSGVAAAGFDVFVFAAAGMATTLVSGGAGLATAAGPQRLTDTTDGDGRYELLVDQPGRFNVSVARSDRSLSLPTREVEIPDVDTFRLDLDYSGGVVTGTVLDRQTRGPIAGARILLRARQAPEGASVTVARTTADGRFTVELREGEYILVAGAEGYATSTRDVVVSSDGAQLLVELVHVP